jgi:hypothetical protein
MRRSDCDSDFSSIEILPQFFRSIEVGLRDKGEESSMYIGEQVSICSKYYAIALLCTFIRYELARALTQISTSDLDNSQITHVTKAGKPRETIYTMPAAKGIYLADHAVWLSSGTLMHIPVFPYIAYAW